MYDKYNRADDVTPSDTVDVSYKAFVTGSAGTITFNTKNTAGVSGEGMQVTITANAGEIYPIHVAKVWATGTSASNIIGLN